MDTVVRRPEEVARLCGVDPKTVTRWTIPPSPEANPENYGRQKTLGSFRTLGNQRRYTETHLITFLGEEAYDQLKKATIVLTPTQVGRLFSIDPKTVTRLVQRGRIGCVTLPGGHRRYTGEHLSPLIDEETILQRLASNKKLMTPTEVAVRYRVDPKTVTRWARAGKLNAIRTPGGHRRYDPDQVEELWQPCEVR